MFVRIMDFSSIISSINYLSVIVAALSSFVVGMLWYGPVLFGKAWMAENGFSDEDVQGGNMLRTYGTAFVLGLIIAFNLDMFLGADATFTWGLTAGALAGIGWVAASIGTMYLFEKKSLKLFLINGGYHAVNFTVMGGILGAW